MKIEKGQPGYLQEQKKKEIVKTVISFVGVATLLIIGYVTTGTKLNWLTLFAILGCLPACKCLVGVITRFPYRSISMEKVSEIKEHTSQLTVAYDLLLTSYEKIMPIDCIVISGSTICGYASNKKMDSIYAAQHIKKILGQNNFTNLTVKIFPDYVAFLSRAEGMNNIAEVDKTNSTKKDRRMKQIILNVSL